MAPTVEMSLIVGLSQRNGKETRITRWLGLGRTSRDLLVHPTC